MLVREHHGDAREPTGHRPPDVGAELVAVQDLHAFATQEALQAQECPEVDFAPASEREKPGRAGLELLEVGLGRLLAIELGPRRPANHAQRRVEALGVKSSCDQPRQVLRAAVAAELVNQRDNAHAMSLPPEGCGMLHWTSHPTCAETAATLRAMAIGGPREWARRLARVEPRHAQSRG